MQTSFAKKLFAVGLAASTVAMIALPLTAFAAAHAEGTNVLKPDGTVGMVIGSQFRPYTSAGAFLTYGFNSWSSVVTANSEDLALPVGSFIAPQDGKVFCATETKGTDVKGECALVTAGQKAAFTSAAVFTGLGFSFSRAQSGDSSFLAKTSNIDNTTAAHRTGVLVNNAGTVQLVGASGLLGIPDIATFNSWGYSFADVVPANAADKAMSQTGVMASRVAGQLSPTALTGGSTTPAGALNVSLASDNPAAGTIVASSSAATLAKFVFSGTGVVTSVTLKRIGVSGDSTLDQVYLFNGAQRLTDSASVGSNSTINFSNGGGLFTVNGSMTITVASDILTGTSGQIVGVQLTGVTLSNGTVGGLPISGNLMSIASASNLATGSFSSPSTAAATTDPINDVTVWQSTLTVSNHNVTLNRMTMREIGSINYADISNIRLLVDGTQVALAAVLDSNGYATLAVSPGKSLTTGSHTFKVVANVTGGATRTFTFSLRNKADINLVDDTYGVGILLDNTNLPLSGYAYTVSGVTTTSSSMTVQKTTDSPSGNVSLNSSDVVIGRWLLTAYGENIKIDTLKMGYVPAAPTSVNSLRNGRIMIGTSLSNLSQYGSTATLSKCTADPCTTGGGTSYTVNYTVAPGTQAYVELRADMYDNDGTPGLANNSTLLAYMMATSDNAQGVSSGVTTDIPNASTATAANLVTVTQGSLTLAKTSNYAAQTIVPPQTNYKLGSYTLNGSSSEDINVDTIAVEFGSTGGTFPIAALSNVKVLYNGVQEAGIKSSITASTTSWSVSHTLAKNNAATVDVYGDVDTTVTGSALITYATVSGTTVSSGQAVASNAATATPSTGVMATGQTITYGAGTIVSSVDGSSPVAANIVGNQTKTIGAFKFRANNDTYKLTELSFINAARTTIQSLVLKAGGSALNVAGDTSITLPVSATTTFSNLQISVPAGQNITVTVDAILGGVGTGAGTSSENVQLSLSAYKATTSGGTQKLHSDESSWANRDAAAQYVFKALPTISNLTLPTSKLVNGTNSLAKISISSGGSGTIAWTQLIFTVNKSAAPTIATSTPVLYDADSNTAVANVTCASQGISGNAQTSGYIKCTSVANDQEVTGAKNYVLKATVQNAATANTDNVQAFIDNNSGGHDVARASNAAQFDFSSAVVTAASPTFVWSDENLSTHAVASSADYFNDYLIKNLPTDTQNLTY